MSKNRNQASPKDCQPSKPTPPGDSQKSSMPRLDMARVRELQRHASGKCVRIPCLTPFVAPWPHSNDSGDSVDQAGYGANCE